MRFWAVSQAEVDGSRAYIRKDGIFAASLLIEMMAVTKNAVGDSKRNL
jgi:hypothetical protein